MLETHTEDNETKSVYYLRAVARARDALRVLFLTEDYKLLFAASVNHGNGAVHTAYLTMKSAIPELPDVPVLQKHAAKCLKLIESWPLMFTCNDEESEDSSEDDSAYPLVDRNGHGNLRERSA